MTTWLDFQLTNTQDIAVRMKDDLNIEQLYNPDYLVEVAAVGNDSEPVFVSS